MGRGKRIDRSNWPPNLTAENRPKGLYYKYDRPDLPVGHPEKRITLGYGDQKEIFAAAIQANQVYSYNKDLVKILITKPSSKGSFRHWLEARYKKEILPQRKVNGLPLSPETLKEYYRIVSHIDKEFGHERIKDVTQEMLAAYLNKQTTPETHNKHRAQLVLIYKYMVSDGVVLENLPEKIVKKDLGRRVRERLTLDGYKAIFNNAPFHIQSAMELSLSTLQRRTDIHGMRFRDYKDGHLYVIQSKTRKYGKSAYLRIPGSLPLAHSERGHKTLAELIESCRDNIVSNYLVHHKPARRRKSKEKGDFAQLSKKQITDGFAEARDSCGFFDHTPPEKRPTFHELLALGEYLREQAGWLTPEIQLLKGHTSLKMTTHYLDGHDWTTVSIPNRV